MEAPTLQAPQGDTVITDEEFDLMVGELELVAPENSSNPTTCAISHIYCALQ